MMDPLDQRLEFVLEGQRHADHFLSPIADPAGKEVLVVGAGAGTDVLWCLRHGAREVIGIDILEQDGEAVREAIDQLGLERPGRYSFHRLGAEEVDRLGRRFELVLSNNVFEHVGPLAEAFAACARVVEPDRGRLAIFTSPLYYSSAGSHLPTEPWAHLWADPEELRDALVAGDRLPPGHPLHRLPLDDYLHREIGLNRMRLADFLAAAAAAGLVPIQLGIVPDPALGRLGEHRERLEPVAAAAGLDPADFAIAGIAIELVRPGDGPPADPPPDLRPTAELRLAEERRRHGVEVERRRAAQAEAAALRDLLARVEASPSYRLGRTLTAPARWLRAKLYSS